VGSYTGEVVLLRLDTEHGPEVFRTLRVFGNAVKGLAVAGNYLFAACASTEVAWINLQTLQVERRLPKAHDKIANACVAFGAQRFASVGRDRVLKLWLGDSVEAFQTPHPNSVKCISASPDGRTLMTGSYGGTVAAFDVPTRRWHQMVRPTISGISAITFHEPDNAFIAASYDGQLHRVGT